MRHYISFLSFSMAYKLQLTHTLAVAHSHFRFSFSSFIHFFNFPSINRNRLLFPTSESNNKPQNLTISINLQFNFAAVVVTTTTARWPPDAMHEKGKKTLVWITTMAGVCLYTTINTTSETPFTNERKKRDRGGKQKKK